LDLAEESNPIEVVITFPAHGGMNPDYFNVATELVKLGMAVPINMCEGHDKLLQIYNLSEINYFLELQKNPSEYWDDD